MIAFTVNYLVARSPRVRRFLWRHIYETLGRLFADLDWHFLSYGYVPVDATTQPLVLEAEDEKNRAFVQLYHHVGESAGLAGRDILEVSSGRGGGSAFMATYMGPRRVVGLDRAVRAVTYSRRRHRRPNLSYLAGDAEVLPFPDASFDVVASVESSHCYGSMVGFLREVHRVLRPGGAFVWADVRNTEDVPATDAAFREADLVPWLTEDITANVLASLDQTNELKVQTVRAHCPRYLVPLMMEFAGVPGSTIYREFARRDKQYLHYACRRS